jgi:hypothetical protein
MNKPVHYYDTKRRYIPEGGVLQVMYSSLFRYSFSLPSFLLLYEETNVFGIVRERECIRNKRVNQATSFS